MQSWLRIAKGIISSRCVNIEGFHHRLVGVKRCELTSRVALVVLDQGVRSGSQEYFDRVRMPSCCCQVQCRASLPPPSSIHINSTNCINSRTGLEQRADAACVPAHRRKVQRQKPVLAGATGFDVRIVHQQVLHHLILAMKRCELKQGSGKRIRGIDVQAYCEKHVQHSAVAVAHSTDHWRV